MASDDPRGPRERAYDDEIYPLMQRLIEVCRREGIPFVASFELDAPPHDPTDRLYCTSILVESDATARMHTLARVAEPARAQVHAFVLRRGKGGHDA